MIWAQGRPPTWVWLPQLKLSSGQRVCLSPLKVVVVLLHGAGNKLRLAGERSFPPCPDPPNPKIHWHIRSTHQLGQTRVAQLREQGLRPGVLPVVSEHGDDASGRVLSTAQVVPDRISNGIQNDTCSRHPGTVSALLQSALSEPFGKCGSLQRDACDSPDGSI